MCQRVEPVPYVFVCAKWPVLVLNLSYHGRVHELPEALQRPQEPFAHRSFPFANHFGNLHSRQVLDIPQVQQNPLLVPELS
jgi:hypothetical protein